MKRCRSESPFGFPETLIARATVATVALTAAAGAASGVDATMTFDLNAVFCIGPEYDFRSALPRHPCAAPRVAASFNQALQRTRPSRHDCDRGVPWAASLSLGR